MKTTFDSTIPKAFLAGALLASSLFAFTSRADDSLTFTPYGTIKFDGVYDSKETRPGDYSNSVVPNSPTTGKSTSEMMFTGNQSRFGLDMVAPSWGGADITAKLEADFYNPANVSDFRATPQMRYAWIKMFWKDWNLGVVAGQIQDTIAPFYSATLNYDVLFGQGQIGYRRGGIKVWKGFDLGGGVLTGELELARENSDSGLSAGASGADSRTPQVQGRLSYSRPLLTEKPTIVGVSFLQGKPQTYGAALQANGAPTDQSIYYTADEQVVLADLQVPVMANLMFQGQVYHGQDLAGLYGLSKSYFKTQTQTSEDGGWIQGVFNITDNLWVAAGYGFAEIEDPQDVPAAAFPAYTVIKNTTPFADVRYVFNKALQAGFEVSQITARYVGGDYNIANRYQVSMMLGF